MPLTRCYNRYTGKSTLVNKSVEQVNHILFELCSTKEVAQREEILNALGNGAYLRVCTAITEMLNETIPANKYVAERESRETLL